jgi:hypothetical protein
VEAAITGLVSRNPLKEFFIAFATEKLRASESNFL